MHILAINAGSSSVKTSLFDMTGKAKEEAQPPLWQANLDAKHNQLEVQTTAGDKVERTLAGDEIARPLETMLLALWQGPKAILTGPSDVQAVGHRIVHGGPRYYESVLIDESVKEEIRALFEFAPLHNPANLHGIECAEKIFSADTGQVAVFDTAFHHNLPPAAATYALPYELCQRYQIRRYGFHGINHAYCAGRAAQLLGRKLEHFRVIVCHLGNGCSVTAVRDGTSLDTTMGFTPLDGLVMGTRSGAIDPGILLYLMEKESQDRDQLDQLLDRQSGLLGVSGISSDMREILKAREEGNARSALAFEVFIHSLSGYIGMMLSRLNGADALVFTGGIGEHAAQVRTAACQNLSFAGVDLDEQHNQSCTGDCEISAKEAKVRTLVVQAQENWAIARETLRLVRVHRG